MIDIDEYCKTVDKSSRKYDITFCLFYYKAIKKLLDFSDENYFSCLNRYFKVFQKYFNEKCKENYKVTGDNSTLVKLLKDSLFYRATYIYKNSAFLSSAVAFHFRNTLKENSNYLRRFSKRKLIKICSLGGGPTSDIVAIVTVLESIARKKGVMLDFRITVIDYDIKWKNTCITVLSCLEQFKNATWKIDFIQTNLYRIFFDSPETCKTIQEADIVTMVMLISHLPRKKLQEGKMVKHISTLLQPQAMLFILDWGQTDLITSWGGYLGEIDDLQLVYEELCDCHTLDAKAVEKLYCLYEKHFENFRSNLSFNVFARVWIKNSSTKSNSSVSKFQRFQTNFEKFKPIESYFNEGSFKSWEKVFVKQQENNGLQPNFIKKKINSHIGKRNRMLSSLKKKTRFLNEFRDELLYEYDSLMEVDDLESTQKYEEAWNKYWIQKMRFSCLKGYIYKFLVSSLLDLSK
ncbi:uncharacterized protein TNIN_117391 [Trichonephila inaurata madagascariensis]|uniref:Uncharacterized protein n=1 Tax=Trichonephila inaurata madagascariensis TaxID=2747483 RepID=A0A8X6X6N1_9ARAC|nr:uncharacterized protein TNIN_117391 [Trichonephila inaurata madagascariensis]